MHMAVKPAALKAVWIGNTEICNRIINYFVEKTGAKTLKPSETRYTDQEVVFVDHSVLIDEGKYNPDRLHAIVNMPQIKILVVLFDPDVSKETGIIGLLEKEGFSVTKIMPEKVTSYALGAIDVYEKLLGKANQFGFDPALPVTKYGEIEPVKKFAEGFVLVTDVTNIPDMIRDVYDTKVYDYELHKGLDSYNDQPLILVNKFNKISKKSELFSVNREPHEGDTDKTTIVIISDEEVRVPIGVTAYKFELKNNDAGKFAKFFVELGNRIQPPKYTSKRKEKEDKPPERDDKGPRALRRRKKHDEE